MKADVTKLENKANKEFLNLRPCKSKKLDLLIQKLHSMMETSFTGYVKINFSQGSIGRVEKFEEILKGIKEKD